MSWVDFAFATVGIQQTGLFHWNVSVICSVQNELSIATTPASFPCFAEIERDMRVKRDVSHTDVLVDAALRSVSPAITRKNMTHTNKRRHVIILSDARYKIQSSNCRVKSCQFANTFEIRGVWLELAYVVEFLLLSFTYRITTNRFILCWYGVLEIEKIVYHDNDVIMGAIASQITSFAIVCSTVYSAADHRKHQSSASLAFVWGIHRRPVNSPHKWPVTRKCFHLMTSSCNFIYRRLTFYSLGDVE